MYILSGKTTALIFAETGIERREEEEVLPAHHHIALIHLQAIRRKSNYKTMQEN